MSAKREPVTRERIMDAAVAVVQRHGPAKAAVVDVARLLGVNHAMIYRHFESKEALFDAITERWLSEIDTALEAIAKSNAAPDKRLRKWMETLSSIKRKRVADDPEMFAVYRGIADTSRGAVDAHVEHMRMMIAKIIEDGVTLKLFKVKDARAAAVTVLDATMAYHKPDRVVQTADQDVTAELSRLLDLLIAGLKAGVV